METRNINGVAHVDLAALAQLSGYSVSHLADMVRATPHRGAVRSFPRVRVNMPLGGKKWLYEAQKCLTLIQTAPGAKPRRRHRDTKGL